MTYMKVFKRNYKTKRGYLLYCLSLDVEEDENGQDEWEGRITVMKKLLKQSREETKDLKDITEKRVKELNQKIEETHEKVEQKIERLEQNILIMMQKLMAEKNNAGDGSGNGNRIEPQKKIAGIQEFLQK